VDRASLHSRLRADGVVEMIDTNNVVCRAICPNTFKNCGHVCNEFDEYTPIILEARLQTLLDMKRAVGIATCLTTLEAYIDELLRNEHENY
jgi:hypothetical protein